MSHFPSARERANFLQVILHGLRQAPRSLPCKYFYDEVGARLFEQICTLPEYYLTRTELAIMERHAAAMAALLGPRCLLIEYGCGSGLKTRLLLDHLSEPSAYVPIDLAQESLRQLAQALGERYPRLTTVPLVADFTEPFALPPLPSSAARRVIYFPGSTIGNFTPEATLPLFQQARAICGRGGALVLGADLQKDPAELHRAYNDRQGVTAAFNLNLLARLNRDLEADFPLAEFWHHAVYNPCAGRIEMYLVSHKDQIVHVGGEPLSLREGEPILTEYSYKYTLRTLHELAGAGGWEVRQVWTDDARRFAVLYLLVKEFSSGPV